MGISAAADGSFEAAADAVASGDLAALRRLLGDAPELASARSGREHGATLLHYVAANGVERERQRTPANIVAIAQALLDAGAEVDATAHCYGAECTALELAATSAHPERAGVVEPLLGLLLDRGARMEESLLRACLANGRVRAAEFLAGRLAGRGAKLGFVAAAGLGWLDRVKACLDAEEGRRPEEMGEGFLYACQFGRDAVVSFLLERGADPGFADAQGQTALHHAAIGGQASTVALLIERNPPLEAVNVYGGTPLGQALWSAAHGGDTAACLEILQALIAAGAQVPERHVPVNPRIDAWLKERGSLAEPRWHWRGEGEEADAPA